jgi:hypothetical protein
MQYQSQYAAYQYGSGAGTDYRLFSKSPDIDMKSSLFHSDNDRQGHTREARTFMERQSLQENRISGRNL